jgi:UDP-N-acetylenolpyruvoylglucosamine reductase
MNISDKFQKDKILAPFCTYQIGGKADMFLDATSIEDIEEAIVGRRKKSDILFSRQFLFRRMDSRLVIRAANSLRS